MNRDAIDRKYAQILAVLIFYEIGYYLKITNMRKVNAAAEHFTHTHGRARARTAPPNDKAYPRYGVHTTCEQNDARH